ncbi:MAG: hypothetical protein Q7S74_04005, partial [Nanoarchaeota archaeon]|nr:hypothetical protein [Nanoarchaeota archaeon]
MKTRRISVLSVLFLAFILLSVSFVSASWFGDLISRLRGDGVQLSPICTDSLYSVVDSLNCGSDAQIGRLVAADGNTWRLCKKGTFTALFVPQSSSCSPNSQAGTYRAPDGTNWQLCYDSGQLNVYYVLKTATFPTVACSSGYIAAGTYKGADGISDYLICYKINICSSSAATIDVFNPVCSGSNSAIYLAWHGAGWSGTWPGTPGGNNYAIGISQGWSSGAPVGNFWDTLVTGTTHTSVNGESEVYFNGGVNPLSLVPGNSYYAWINNGVGNSNPVQFTAQSCGSSSCSNECSSTGQNQCSGSDQLTCGNYDADSCLEWFNTASCAYGCNSGTGQCNPSAPYTCNDPDGFGLNTATSILSSSGNLWDDECVQGTLLVNSCTGSNCYLIEELCSPVSDPRIILQVGSPDGVWSAKVYCDYGCDGGKCNPVLSCTNECSFTGSRQCSGTTGYQTCGNYDADSCLEWSGVNVCASGSSCIGSSCILLPTLSFPDSLIRGFNQNSITTTGNSQCNSLGGKSCLGLKYVCPAVPQSWLQSAVTCTQNLPNNQCAYAAVCDNSGTCSDSDGGKDYTLKGTAVAGANTLMDYCESSGIVHEYYCGSPTNAASLTSESYTCPLFYACINGACVSTFSPVNLY